MTDVYLGQRGRPGGPQPLGGLSPLAVGKVRDLYELDAERLVFVTTDRISAFDVVMAEGVPGKGRVLTRLAAWWFERTADVAANHLLSTDVGELVGLDARERAELEGRILIVRRARPTPVEWVVRGYLAGSGLAAYRRTGELWGQSLPGGLELASALPEPLLTPTTKEDSHDRPLTLEEAEALVGTDCFRRARERSLALFRRGGELYQQRGLILADTKFEFGIDPRGELLLIDELFTPDSSRLWPADEWRPGTNPASYDKQILRDYLESTGWNKEAPAPSLPQALVERLAARYRELEARVLGR